MRWIIFGTIYVFLLIVLVGCAGMNVEDRALLNEAYTMAYEAKNMAQEAQNEADWAVLNATKASGDAAIAAGAAIAASDRANRIFWANGDK